MSNVAEPLSVSEHEAAQVERANASNATPVVFVHGLWLLPSSWDRWVTLFEEAGYVGVDTGLARRSRDGRRGQRAPRGASRARGSARSPTTRRRSSAAWIGSP